jgi:hypothetical protein
VFRALQHLLEVLKGDRHKLAMINDATIPVDQVAAVNAESM